VLRALAEATFGVFVCHLLFLALFRRFTPDFYADPAPATRTLLYLAVLGAAWVTALLARRVPYVSRLF
jgi:surface polysaccharide O-acyltransferase-like enzyme